MTPEVESVVISVTTTWEGASAQEIETDVIEFQEARLGNVKGLLRMTSTSQSGQGQIKLEYVTGTDIADARTEVDLKLAEVPGYPEGVNRPVVVDADPESVDYIAWVALASGDPDFDPTTLRDFVMRRIVPRLERISGVAEVGFLGAQERELHIVVDPERLASRGLTYASILSVLREENGNWSAGKLREGKNDVRVRTVGRFASTRDVEEVVLRNSESGTVLLRDVAEVKVGFKERTDWVRARGHLMPYFNFQLESGANLLETMAGIDAEMESLNADDGLLGLEAKRRGLNGKLEMVKSYDATRYVRQALGLVRSNILVGGIIATIVLLLFLRSLRTVGIVALAIPISIIGAIVVLFLLGRTVNIVSLAGMAFAVGMVVDNAIVVIENIFRHLEMGKDVRRASIDGAEEVAGAVLASTLTTVVVFIPILLIQDSAGQLFRDIALAIVASVGISLVVSVVVIPAASATLLKPGTAQHRAEAAGEGDGGIARRIAGIVAWLGRSRVSRVGTIVVFTVVTVLGIRLLSPPLDYLPTGNRNIAFGILFPPPAYNLGQLSEIGDRIEERVRPFWEASGDEFAVEDVLRRRGELPEPGERARHPDRRWRGNHASAHRQLLSRGYRGADVPRRDRGRRYEGGGRGGAPAVGGGPGDRAGRVLLRAAAAALPDGRRHRLGHQHRSDGAGARHHRPRGRGALRDALRVVQRSARSRELQPAVARAALRSEGRTPARGWSFPARSRARGAGQRRRADRAASVRAGRRAEGPQDHGAKFALR